MCTRPSCPRLPSHRIQNAGAAAGAAVPPTGGREQALMSRPSEDTSLSPADERRSGLDRRTGRERRSRSERRAEFRRTTDAGHRLLNRSILVGTEPGGLSLRRLFPHAQFSDAEAAERLAAIAAHRGELDASIGRDVGPSVAALDYLLNISRDLADPTIVEHEVLEVVERRSVTDPLTGLRSEEHTSELQSRLHLVCRLLLEKKKNKQGLLDLSLH